MFQEEEKYNDISFYLFSLFIDESRVTKTIRHHLKLDEEKCILTVHPYNNIQEHLRKLGEMEKKIWVSPGFFFKVEKK